MKKLIIVTLITTCAALCAAVWPHNNATEQTPVPAAETAVSAKEATVAEIEEPTALAEKEKGTIPRQEAPREEQPELEIGPIETPVASELQLSTGRYPLRIPHQSQLRPTLLKNCSPATKFMWRASAGWSTRDPITAKMARTFTKTETKLESWGEICSSPLHSLPIHVIMKALNCWTVLNFDRSYHESTNHIERQ